MKNQIDILEDVSKKLKDANIEFMVTGSIAMNYYIQPRMTRDIDIVISIERSEIDKLIELFQQEYYISREAIEESIQYQSLFNVIHNESVIKVDFIILKDGEYEQKKFSRKKKIKINYFQTYIASLEDLILSKLNWARNTHSAMQENDIKNLLKLEFDKNYLVKWLKKLSLKSYFDEIISK